MNPRVCIVQICNDYKLATDTEPSYAMCLQKTCLSKGHVELGVVAVICVISVCHGNVTLGVYWACFTHSTYRFGQVSNSFNTLKVVITPPPPHVK